MNPPFAAPSGPGLTRHPITPSRGPNVVTTKEFACVFPGCTKAFTRAEHLHRHALNHNEGNGSACHRCSAVFKRRDLLERHMARHKEKDDEAGGEGLGKLLTRKRLWRDSTGAIVSKKRPEHEKERKQSSHSRSIPSSTPMNHATRADAVPSLSPQSDLPLSPRSLDLRPVSNGSEAIDPLLLPAGSPDKRQVPVANMISSWPVSHVNTPFREDNLDSLDFLCNGSWGTFSPDAETNTDSLDSGNLDLDLAASSNNPFPTVKSYSWLFSDEPWPREAGNTGVNGYPNSQNISPANAIHRTSQGVSTVNSPDFQRYPDTRLPPIAQKAFRTEFAGEISNSSSNHGVPAFAEFLAMSQSNNYLREPASQSPPETSLPVRELGIGSRNEAILTTQEFISGPDFPQLSSSRRLRRLPIIGDAARNGILQLVENGHPKAYDGSIISCDDPSLSTATLQHFSDLFFRRFNTSYPLLHQSTFDPAAVDPLLLFAIIQLGASFSTKDDHIFAICLHNTMRAQIFGHQSFNPQPCLWMLQTIFLVECFGKSRAGQLQHEMSHLFHGLLIELLHNSECLLAHNPRYDTTHDLEYRWRREVHTEQRRRLAFLFFIWSTQHALLFSDAPSLSPTEIRLSLPWDSVMWEADTAESWAFYMSNHRPQSYLPVLKTYLHPASQNPLLLSIFSRVIILHGLLSIALDLQGREQLASGPILLHSKPWKLLITQAYETWKAGFDIATKATLSTLPEHQSAEFQKRCTATLAVYHVAFIALEIPITYLQIHAGARHILGRSIEPAELAGGKQNVSKWATSGRMEGAVAVSHAALLIRDGITKLQNWDAGDAFYYPWCLYIATLSCWAFITGVPENRTAPQPGDNVDSDNTEDTDWDARAEMNALISAITRTKPEDLWRIRGKYRIGDLPRVIAKVLGGIRWAVVQEGVVVLRGLGHGR